MNASDVIEAADLLKGLRWAAQAKLKFATEVDWTFEVIAKRKGFDNQKDWQNHALFEVQWITAYEALPLLIGDVEKMRARLKELGVEGEK